MLLMNHGILIGGTDDDGLSDEEGPERPEVRLAVNVLGGDWRFTPVVFGFMMG